MSLSINIREVSGVLNTALINGRNIKAGSRLDNDSVIGTPSPSLKKILLKISSSASIESHQTKVFGSRNANEELTLSQNEFSWDLQEGLKATDYVKLSLIQRSLGQHKHLASCSFHVHRLVQNVNNENFPNPFVVNDIFCNSNNQPIELTVRVEMKYTPSKASVEPEMVNERSALLGATNEGLHRSCESIVSASPKSVLHTPAKMKIGEMNNLNKVARSNSNSAQFAPKIRLMDRFRLLSPIRRNASASSLVSNKPIIDNNNDVIIQMDKIQDSSKQHDQLTGLDNDITDEDLESSPMIKTSKPIRRSVADHSSWQVDTTQQQFQVCVTIIEARLSGSTLDPCVTIQVGNQTKDTAEHEATHRPVFNEYFVFDFFEPAAIFYDKLITFTVINSKKMLRRSNVIGQFKMDMATVYEQADHQFFHKWAVLTDRDLVFQAVKGYLKVDVSVCGKGDKIKQLPRLDVDEDEDNIENNLLLPDASSRGSMQQARYVMRIHSGDALSFETGMISTVRKAIMGDTGQSADESFVHVAFAGHSAETSRQAGSSPNWHEQIVFTEFFPPLVRRIRLQLKSSGRLGSRTVATHWLDLAAISDKGTHGDYPIRLPDQSKSSVMTYSPSGFLPTFGPAYVYLYGPDIGLSPNALEMVTGSGNDSLQEGCSYRGRLLISLHVLVCDDLQKFRKAPPVTVEPCQMVTERNVGAQETFLLYGCVMDVSMLDKALANKPVTLEITMGARAHDLEAEAQAESATLIESYGAVQRGSSIRLTQTPDAQAIAHSDSPHCSVAFGNRKPCVYATDSYPDTTFRLFHSNVVSKMLLYLETSLADVQFLLQSNEDVEANDRLNETLEHFLTMAYQYQNYLKHSPHRDGMNRLDQERHRACERQVDRIMGTARKLRAAANCATTAERCHTMEDCIGILQQLARSPQPSLPDVFVSLLCAGRRLAYTRIAARSLIFSPNENERGDLCGQLRDLYLKPYGRKGATAGVAGLLHAYFWLGYNRKRETLLDGMPKGYIISSQIRNACSPMAAPPSVIEFDEQHEFELRCYLYQARSLIAADDIGLSDPFARVIFQGRAAQTKTINETLNPEWNQTLVIAPVILFGDLEDVQRHPPVVVVELFDEDQLTEPEPLGYTTSEPAVKVITEPYRKAALQWYSIYSGAEPGGELLAAFELIQLNAVGGLPSDVPVLAAQPLEQTQTDMIPIINVPPSIKPFMAKYKMEVLFWGIRNLKRLNLMTIDHPRVDVEIAGRVLSSGVIPNLSLSPNFPQLVRHMDIELPEQPDLWPAISIRCYDCRAFGRDTLVGVHVVRRVRETTCSCRPGRKSLKADEEDYDETNEENALERGLLELIDGFGMGNGGLPGMKIHEQQQQPVPALDMNELDWWSKYWASVDDVNQPKQTSSLNHVGASTKQSKAKDNSVVVGHKFIPKHLYEKKTGKMQKTANGARKKKAAERNTSSKRRQMNASKAYKLTIFPCELEAVPEFEHFQDWVKAYDLMRGKSAEGRSDAERTVGCFKGAMQICKYPLPPTVSNGLFQTIPSNDQTHVLVRIYIVKATDLHPMDINGKADPYLYLTLGKTKINDKENYISKQLNPVFGKCFEIEALFPHESQLSIHVYDWDLVGRDDLIGQTQIDLENRFYSSHRATCGLASSYQTEGYHSWRDWLKPNQILTRMCKEHSLNGPYYLAGQVRIENKVFTPDAEFNSAHKFHTESDVLALYVLQHWNEMPVVGCHLVPEHVETRPLYQPDKPGIVQGQLEMWVDMFPMNVAGSAKPVVDIAPRKPQSYELRVTIWNTDEVVLEDDELLTGEKCSDIYVTGKLKGPEDYQATDVHYRSLTGEGNFNWRFLFPFDYLEAEEMIVLTRKQTLFSWDETEVKTPPRLELQVWDADNFSADDFLGAIMLDLTSLPRGAKTAKRCTLDLFPDEDDDEDRNLPMVSLFKHKRIRGWWPLAAKNNVGIYELAGKVEAELQLLTKEESERNPAGFGREAPNPLDLPKLVKQNMLRRPDNSFLWFVNPMLSARHILWRNHKWAICKLGLVIMAALMVLMFLYSLPGYFVKKLLDV